MRPILFSLVLFLCLQQSVLLAQRPASAQPNVQVLENAVQIPGLNRERTLRVYLPPGYEQGNKRYPVMYMHDAQNLFDAATSYAGEWGVDEILNDLAKSEGLELIVVGIDNGQEHRNTELSPWANEHLGEPEGAEYTRFIVEVVKPFIDKKYRTKKGRPHTAIMGSSLGGLISHYALYTYPKVFSKAGIFSPSYWVSNKVFDLTKENPVPANTRLYMVVGKKEGPGMYENMEKMYAFIKAQGHPADHISAETNLEGEHNEAFWNSEFADAVKWLFKK